MEQAGDNFRCSAGLEDALLVSSFSMNAADKPGPRAPLWPALVLPAALLAWIAGWIWHFGAVLINDEYAAVDYFYRVVEAGEFFPTPFKLHKPLSVAMGFFAWVSESPLGFELATAVFASALVLFFYLVTKRELGFGAGLIFTAALCIHPDLMYYSATGSTVIPFSALALAALYLVLRKDELPWALWGYAGCFLAAGLFRPESWLFAAPAAIWWWPGLHDRRGLFRLLSALCLIGLGPAIWFGKDWLINDNLLHGFVVATRDNTVGTGDQLSAAYTSWLFPIRITNFISLPVSALGVLGLCHFLWRRGIREALSPLVVFPAMVAVYVWLIVYMGVYPVQRYWFFNSLFVLFFAVYLLRELSRFVVLSRTELQAKTLFAAMVVGALAYALSRPPSIPPDGRWLLLALGFAAGGLGMALAVPRLIFSKWRATGVVFLLVFAVMSYPVFLSGLWGRKISELRLESKIQSQMEEVRDFLRDEIPPGQDIRILIPSRRNEQLNWLWRDRETPHTITFREAFYLYWACFHPQTSGYVRSEERAEFCRSVSRYDFLVLHPEWIVFVPDDYQFYGPNEMFKWMENQDRAEIRGASVELARDTGNIRLFKVTYPGDRVKMPLPPIP